MELYELIIKNRTRSIIMSIKEIIIDSIKYPLLDWKKILILGLIAVICQFPLNIISPFNLQNGLLIHF